LDDNQELFIYAVEKLRPHSTDLCSAQGKKCSPEDLSTGVRLWNGVGVRKRVLLCSSSPSDERQVEQEEQHSFRKPKEYERKIQRDPMEDSHT